MPTGEDIAFLSGHSRNAEGAEILNRNILRNNAVRGASHSTLLDISLNHDLNLRRSLRSNALCLDSYHRRTTICCLIESNIGSLINSKSFGSSRRVLFDINDILQSAAFSYLRCQHFIQIDRKAERYIRRLVRSIHARNVSTLLKHNLHFTVICKRCKRYAHDNHERGRQQSQQTSFEIRFLHVISPIL